MPPVIRHQSLGATLAELRKARGLKQRELAAMCGVSESSISMYERDSERPKPYTLERLLNGLNVPLSSRAVIFMRAGYESALLRNLIEPERTMPPSVFIVSTAHKPLMAFTDEKQATAYRDGLGAQATRFVHVDSVQLKG